LQRVAACCTVLHLLQCVEGGEVFISGILQRVAGLRERGGGDLNGRC